MLAEHPPGVALRTWLAAFVQHVASKRQLPLALSDEPDGQRSEAIDQWHAAMHEVASTLLVAAQQSGDVRADVEASDLTGLAHGIALSGADATRAERLLDLAWRGMAPAAVAVPGGIVEDDVDRPGHDPASAKRRSSSASSRATSAAFGS